MAQSSRFSPRNGAVTGRAGHGVQTSLSRVTLGLMLVLAGISLSCQVTQTTVPTAIVSPVTPVIPAPPTKASILPGM